MTGSRRNAAMILLAGMVFLACASSGCGKKDASDRGAKRPRIAGIVFQEDQFFRIVEIGMDSAATAHGIELLHGNSDSKLDKEIQLVNTYITDRVDAIAIAPLSVTGSLAALRRAYEKGLKIVIHNNALRSDFVSAAVESNHRNLGVETGKAARAYIERHLSGKARVAILAFKSQLPEQSNARSDGFKQEIGDMPGVTIVAEQDAWLPEMATKRAGDIITANPGIDIIWAANEGGTVGAVMAVRNSQKSGRIAVFGTDITEQLMDFLLSDDDVLQAVTGQRPFEIGYTAVETALKVLAGEHYEKEIIMPGILLTRTDPEAIRAYQRHFRELVGPRMH
jgi:ABC-type sugar transport system substrate-binding protein